jgi:hypothetical protein
MQGDNGKDGLKSNHGKIDNRGDYAGDDTGWAGIAQEKERKADDAAAEKQGGMTSRDLEETPKTRDELEEMLFRNLTLARLEEADPAAEAVKRLPTRWEIRIQSRYDPVAEKTKIYRTLAHEIDDRYDNREPN